jgi:heme-degrading monooxygenase HmoA
MNYQVLPGKEAVFEAACDRVIEAMGGAAGHDESQIYKRVDGHVEGKPAEYLIVSRWNDEAAFDAFVRSDTFKKVTTWGRENILAGRPRHTTYREG